MSFASIWDGTSLGSFLGSVRGELAFMYVRTSEMQKGRMLRREVGLSAVPLAWLAFRLPTVKHRRLARAFRPFQFRCYSVVRFDNPSLRTPGISYAPWDFSGRSAPYHGPEMNVASIWDDGTIDHRRWKFLSSSACEFFDRSPVKWARANFSTISTRPAALPYRPEASFCRYCDLSHSCSATPSRNA